MTSGFGLSLTDEDDRFAFAGGVNLITTQSDNLPGVIENRNGHPAPHRFAAVGFIDPRFGKFVANLPAGFDPPAGNEIAQRSVGETNFLFSCFFFGQLQFIGDEVDRFGVVFQTTGVVVGDRLKGAVGQLFDKVGLWVVHGIALGGRWGRVPVAGPWGGG